MRLHVRPSRTYTIARQELRIRDRAVTIARPTVRSRPLDLYRPEAAPIPVQSQTGFQPDPYVDYGRFLTPEGGILIVYKDIDTRLRHALWRLFAWTVATGLEGWLLLFDSPIHNIAVNIVSLIVMAIINAMIVGAPVEVYRRIEIRPDCMIVEDQDVFWRRLMETWPSFQPGPEGRQVLCGIYGTRFVEYLGIGRDDELDRTPEIFASHLQDAIRQLWLKPYH